MMIGPIYTQSIRAQQIPSTNHIQYTRNICQHNPADQSDKVQSTHDLIKHDLIKPIRLSAR